MKTIVLQIFNLLVCFSLVSPIEINAQKECVVIIQGWEKPKGYVENGKEREEEEVSTRNSVDEMVRGFRQFPGGAKVTALRPNNKMGETGGTGYKDIDDLKKKLKAAICDLDCDDVVITFIGHGNEFQGAFASAKVGNPNEAEELHAEDVAEIIKECKKKVKLISATCCAERYQNTLLQRLDDNKGNLELVEVGLAACKAEQVAKMAKGRDHFFTRYFLEDYYMIIGDPNLMKQIKEEADRLAAAAKKAADEEMENAEAQRAAMEALDAEIKKSKLKNAKEKAEAAAKAAAEAKAADPVNKLKKEIDAELAELNKIPKTQYDQIGQISSPDAVKKHSEKILALIKKLPLEHREEQYKKLIKAYTELQKRIKIQTNRGQEIWKIIKKLNEKIYQLRKALKKEIEQKMEQLIKEAKKENPDNKKLLEELDPNPKGPDQPKEEPIKEPDIQKPPVKIVPKATPSVMALVLHYAFKSAKNKSKAKAKNQDAVETVVPEHDSDNIKFSDKHPISIWMKDKVGYKFVFYKVENKEKNECAIVGYVTDSKGLPVSQIKSIRCKEDCSVTEFSFTDKKGKERVVSIKLPKDKEPVVTIDGENKKANYVETDIDLISKGKKVGKIEIKFKGGNQAPEIKAWDPTIKGNIKRTPVEITEYDKDKGILKIRIKIQGKWKTIKIKLLAHGAKQIQIDDEKPYHDYLVLNYNLFDKDNFRIGDASLVCDDDILTGELWLSKTNTSYPLTGFYTDNGNMLALAETPDGQFSLISHMKNGLIVQKWFFEDELNDVQALHYVPVIDLKEDVNVTVEDDPLKVNLAWETDHSWLNHNEEIIAYQILKFTEDIDDLEVFNILDGEESFNDTDVEYDKKYEYHLSVIVKNTTIDDLNAFPRYDHYSRPLVINVSIEKDEDKKALLPYIIGGAAAGTAAIVLAAGGGENTGCTNQDACNFDSEAIEDDGSCLFLDCLAECGGNAVIGSPCDDADPCTINDVYTSACICEGVFSDIDNDGVCDGEDLCPELNDSMIGMACDDTDPCTINDLYTADCECLGTFQDSDNDGVCDADDLCPDFDDGLIGTGCDDEDVCTLNDVYTSACNCEGIYTDSDNDGVCDAEDQCPDLDDSLIGMDCDDGDDCTINDVYTTDCLCEGTFEDSDDDGVCDADDLCPDFDDGLIGTPCDDGDACTVDDLWTNECICLGATLDYTVEIQTTATSCELDNGIAEAVVSPSGNYQFFWDGELGTDVEFDQSAGSHELELIDLENNCRTFWTYNVAQGQSPDLFDVETIISADNNGNGMIILNLNNPYNGPYQVCWNGQATGTNGCDFGPLSNGLFEITGPADIYNIQVEIDNGAPVPCIHFEMVEIPLLKSKENVLEFETQHFSFYPILFSTNQNSNIEFNEETEGYFIHPLLVSSLQVNVNDSYGVGLQLRPILERQFQSSLNIGSDFIYSPYLRWTAWRHKDVKLEMEWHPFKERFLFNQQKHIDLFGPRIELRFSRQ